jgi:hypothetical protein
LPLLAFLLVDVLPLDAEFFDFEAELFDFDWLFLALASLSTPAIFAPASTAPLTAPVAAPIAAPLTTSVKASVAFAIMPSDFLFTVFFEEEPLEADDLAADFPVDLADLLDDADFELALDDLLDAAFEPEPDLPVDDLDAVPADFPEVDFPVEDDLPADDLDAVVEPEDLLADADFDDVLAAGLAEADLPPLAEEDLLAVVSLLVADSTEFFFVVAIAISLKFF